MESARPAIQAEGLAKKYGDKAALTGFDLEVPTGTVCGLLGPNGAGKTTAVRILSTLLRADAGSATIQGLDVATEAAAIRYRIGLVGQNAAVDEILSAKQNLVMFGRLYHLSLSDARTRAEELLERFDLADTGDKAIKDFSGGMRRRLDLAASLILAPPVLFLDEPTTGLDPRGRNEVWSAVRQLVGDGTTVLLTTQYLEEADQLADRISLVDNGTVIAEGTPDSLKSRIGGDRIEVILRDEQDLDRAVAALTSIGSAPPMTQPDERRVIVPVLDRSSALTEAVRTLDAAGILTDDLAVRRPTLDEVFLHLTGHDTTQEVAA